MIEKMSDTELDHALLYVLRQHVGKENAISRWDMVEIIYGQHVPEPFRNDKNDLDRSIRYAVSRLRIEGHFICDMGNGDGRYLAKDEKEFWTFYSFFISPIESRVTAAKAMKKAAIKKWPNALQPALFDIDSVAVL